MTMQEKDEFKFKELVCGNCHKFLGYINSNRESFLHDFMCSLKCLDDWQTKSKVKDYQVERLKK